MGENLRELVDFYDEFQNKLFDYAEEIKIINNILRKNSVKALCDVGCGTGTHLISFAKLGYECVGIDNSIEMLRKAKEKAKREKIYNIKFIKADIRDAKSLKEWHGKFDAILWIRNTLSSVNEIELALRTQYNLLKNRGIIIFDILEAKENIYDHEILNMDTIVKENTSVVRLNNFKISKYQVQYDSVYLIQTGKTLKMVTNTLLLPLISLDDIIRILKDVGFRYETVIYEYIGIPRVKSSMILARKEVSNNE